LINIFSKFLDLESEESALDHLESLVNGPFQQFDFRHRGIEAKDIERGARVFFQKHGIALEIKTRSRYQLAQLKRSLKKNEAVMIGIDAWPIAEFSFEDPETRPVSYGHWMIVTGLEGNLIQLRDPFSEEVDRVAVVERFREGASGRTRYRLRWKSPPPEGDGHIALLDESIFFRVASLRMSDSSDKD
jgi:hypothetical protein